MTEFSEKCQLWLDTPKADRNLEAGAILMLQANRNRILYQNVLNRKNFEKIEYELKKFIEAHPFIPSQKTVDITTLEHKLAKQPDVLSPENKGKRNDHDSLPETVRSIFEINRELYHVLRSAHEKLKYLSGKNYSAEHRKPIIEEVLSINEKIRINWQTYDKYNGEKVPENKNQSNNQIDFKTVNANKVYLSRLPGQIENKIQKGKSTEAEALRIEARKRYAELLTAGVSFKPEMIEKLKKAGVIE